MTRRDPLRAPAAATRIAAIALLRLHRAFRTRIVLAAFTLALGPWVLVDSSSLIGRLSALASFTVVGLTALAAGAIADDLDSGEYAIIVTHDASPLDVLGGQAAASIALTALLVACQLPFVLHGVVVPRLAPLLLCMAWLAALLSGWLALMLLLATFLEGKANAVAMIAVLMLPVAVAAGLLDRMPPALAASIRNALQLLPQPTQATTMFRAVLYRAPAPAITPWVLIASPFFYFALASVRLHRLQPAGRLTQ